MELKDKVVIVTGASSGIGKATATLLSQKGANVVLAARSKDILESLAKELPHSLAVPTDITKPNAIKALIHKTKEQFGRVDILINNAGQGYDAKVEEIDDATFQHVFELDLMGPVRAMQQVIPLMREQGGGAIVNISSGTALMVLPNMSAYASLKQALAKISLTAREELKKDKITVTVVYPYITDTDFEKNTLKEKNNQEWEDDSDVRFLLLTVLNILQKKLWKEYKIKELKSLLMTG